MKAPALDLAALNDALERATPEERARFGRLVAPFVAAAFAGALATVGADRFTTCKAGPRPPEFAHRHRAWRELAPTIPGARRVGRWWAVPRDAYERWLASRATPPAGLAAEAPAPGTPWSPADVADSLGLRLQKRKRTSK